MSGQNTAIYTVNSTTSVTASGVTPVGSSATYGQTYMTAKQITSGNSATLTLSGYVGKKITSITLNMKSNAGAGAGNLDVKIGTTSVWTIGTSAFNNANWNGAYSTSYVDINQSISHTVQTGENIVILINATTNSLYIDHYSITYEEINTPPTLTNQSYNGIIGTPFSQTPTNSGGSATSWAVVSGTLPTGLTLNTSTGEISGTPTATGTSTVDIQATNAYGDDTKTYDFTIINGPCYTENGPNGSKSGSTSAGDADAGGSPTSTIRLASGSNGGSIAFTTSNINAGNILLRFRAKGWSGSETNVTVTVGSETVNYTTLPTSFGWVEIPFTPLSANPTITFSTIQNKRVHIGNIEVFCLPTCTPITLTQTRPNQAPVDSKVQIEVNDVTPISQVKLNGNTLAFSVINATTIQIEIPNTATAGANTITLEEIPACQTDIPFVVTEYSGACSTLPNTYTDLFISEIYDSQSDNQWYMELYNPTPNPIVLDNVYQLKRSGDKGPSPSYSRTIDLTGTVPPYSVFVLFLGDASPVTCSGITFDFTGIGNGINEKDQIDLFKNGVRVDISEAPNETGYTLKRKVVAGETVPTTSYNAMQWDISSSESCSDLGQFDVDVTTIDLSSPVDITACKVDFTASSSISGVTYKWYYNNVNTMTNWNEVNAANLAGLTLLGETTDNLTISGNVSTIDGFQFYCEVTDGTCSRVSETAVFSFDVIVDCTLPITLTSFATSCEENGFNTIKWTTATETNNDYFIVEKTTDGNNWDIIEKVNGKGMSSSTTHYAITDRNPVNQITYYRLKQVDFDGQTETFNPISVICTSKEHSMTVFPNPASHSVTISLSGYDFENATLNLLSSNGKLVHQIIVSENETVMNMELDLRNFAQGVYLLQWIDGAGKTEMKKLIVQ